ncbi:hypothetical protein V8E54_012921 [Elaphomyces granulatus]
MKFNLLKVRAKSRTVWKRRGGVGVGQANSDQSDMQLAEIDQYLQDLGSRASSEPYSGLATACSLVLDGNGSPSLKSLCLNTISWQTVQFMIAASVIDFLLEKDLLFRPVDYATAMELSVDRLFMEDLWGKFGKIKGFEDIQTPTDDSCLPVYFPDAAQWILRVIAYNRGLHPSLFSLDEVEAAVRSHLQSLC